MLTFNGRGGYSFLPGGSPYSRGVVAAEHFQIEHARLSRPIPWKAGLELAARHVRSAGRPPASVCAIALRSPRPFSFDGFREFNAGYVEALKSLEILSDGATSVARTNVAPGFDPPAEPSLYSFAYTLPVEDARPSFVASGGGEMPEGSRNPGDIVRSGDTSRDAMAAKARFVMDLMEERMRGLGVGWNDVTVANVYTVHDLYAMLAAEILPRLEGAGRHGVTWHYSRPPIEAIEFEVDLRGCAREIVIDPAS